MTPPPEDLQASIDILTPSYNYGRFLEDAMDSVAGQAGVHCRHIVQDAESSDETLDILSRRDDPNLSWTSEPDAGQSDALNRALAAGDSPWVGWLNADEFYLPGAMRHLLSVAQGSRADVVYGDAVFVDQHGNFVRLLPQHRFSKFVLRHYGTIIPTCGMLVRRSAIEAAGWEARLRKIMDWDLFLRLLDIGMQFRHTAFPVGAFRLHSDQVTAGPQEHFAHEYKEMRVKWGSRPTPVHTIAGRLLHASLKQTSGSYRRQRALSAMAERNLRWFADDAAMEAARDVVRIAYPATQEDGG